MAQSYWFISLTGVAMFGVACSRPLVPDAQVIIRHASVIDGSGAVPVTADVAIADGRIVQVGDLSALKGAREIDAQGHVLAPGFIDVHTHADEVADRPGAENFLRMGVTTLVAGNCGSSPVAIGDALSRIEQTTVAVNFATLVGHNSVRRSVMGTEQRAPTADERGRMEQLVAAAMREGAVGFSTGLQYVPGTYADTDEIVALARMAGQVGGLYATHMRNEGTRLEEAVAEALAVGEAAQCRVQISHLKVDSKSHWGSSARALTRIDEARARGLDVQADQYAYTAASSNLGIRFPSWVLEGGQDAIVARLNDEATWGKIREEMKALLHERGFDDLSFAVVATFGPDPSLNGSSLAQIAERRLGASTLDAQLETARQLLREGGAQMVYHLMSEEDVALIMRHPFVSFASDASINVFGEGVPHPRGYGNNARVLGHYVRASKVIALEEAIRKMTSLPAQHFRFDGRGLIKVGYAADLVLFDPAAVTDRASFAEPHAYADGISHVFVNGTLVVDHGEPTGARPGQVLRGPAFDASASSDAARR